MCRQNGAISKRDTANTSSCFRRNKMKAASKPRVWIVPAPFFSHVVCSSQLAEQIGRHGLTVTLFVAKAEIRRLHSSPSRRMLENWKIHGLDIAYRPLQIQSAVMADGVGGPNRFLVPFSQTEDAFEEILKNDLEGESRPTCVISDLALPGTREVATRYNIPAWPFITVSPGYTAANVYINQLVSKGILTLPYSVLDRRCEEEVLSLPGLPLMRMCDISAMNFKDYPMHALGCRNVESLQKAEVILFSGFQELDPRAFRELERLLKNCADKNSKKMPQIWTIGPTFFFLSHMRRAEVDETADGEVHPCMRFLDSQSPSSVLYVAFGTDVNHSQEQIQELAYGLESSQQPFLCVLHPPKRVSNSDEQVKDIFSAIPPDCLARIGSKGLFVNWAPQVDVLSHPSSGGFLSHCGQNSLLESVCMGVPILAWPCKLDQFTNCRFLVEEAHIALEVCPGLLAGGFVGRKDVEKSINALFHSEEGTAVRKKALQMKQRAEESVGENGSSKKNMQALLALIEGAARLNLERSRSQMP